MAKKVPAKDDIDLLSLLSDTERSELSVEAKAAEAKRAKAKKERKSARIGRLQDMGVFDDKETVVDWVPQETVTFWRVWNCTCGSTYEGPAYDTNPTWVRLEKMRVRHYNVGVGEWRDLKTPRPLKGRPSVFRRGDYAMNLPHRVEVMQTQLWSCRRCRTKAVTTHDMARPWTCARTDSVLSMDGDTEPKKIAPTIATHAEMADLKTGAEAMRSALEDMNLDPEDLDA